MRLNSSLNNSIQQVQVVVFTVLIRLFLLFAEMTLHYMDEEIWVKRIFILIKCIS